MKSLTFNGEPEDGRGLLPDRVLHLAVVLAYGNEYMEEHKCSELFLQTVITDRRTDGRTK